MAAKYTYDDYCASHDTLLKIAKDEMSTCLTTHKEKCAPYPLDSTGFIPTRLIDIGVIETPKLVISAESRIEDRRYVPLSHKWGMPDQEEKRAMTTTLESLKPRLVGFDLWSLPRRFLDVFFLCHWMGVRYLWIDSLCIIQVGYNLGGNC